MRLTAPYALAALALTAAIALAAAPLAAQRDTEEWLEDCRDRRWSDRDSDNFCEVRETKLAVRQSISVDGMQNGGVRVIGWDRNEILVRAFVQAQASSDAEAEELAKQVKVETGSTIRADGPSQRRRESWSVSYDIFVPRRTDLDLTTHNGGIGVRDVEGKISFSATNGGVSLAGVGGDVRGDTQNGGLDVTLTGAKWAGEGLDVRTQNGGVRIRIPERYNARLETGTTNGGMSIDFPITVQGRIRSRINTSLGEGGPLVRAITTNGGVTIRRS